MRRSAVKVPVRTYRLTVEPQGRSHKPKDAMRQASKPVSDIDLDMERLRSGDVDTFVDERFVFRRERLRQFQMDSHFPALLSPRLVPSWKLSAAGRLSVERERDWAEPSPRGASTVTKPTLSHALKQADKRSAEALAPWMVSGPASARELCDRRPALYAAQAWSEGSAERESSEPQSTLFLTSASAARAGFDESRPVLESHIAAMRERGRAYNEALKERYEASRASFKKMREEASQQRGGLSSFERVYQDKLQEEASRKVAAMSAKTVEVKKDDSKFQGLGLRK